MKLLILVVSMLLLGLAPAYGAGGKSAAKPSAAKAKPETKAPPPLADGDVLDDPEMRAKFDKLGPLMSEIGVEAAAVAGGKSDGLFLYAEMKGKRATVVVFRDRGKTVKRFIETSRLRDLVEQAWAMDPPGKRWVIMAYEGRGRKFDAHLLYQEDVDLKLSFAERVIALMPERFDGKKLVVERSSPAADDADIYEPETTSLSDGYRST